ncbi:MAG TPA: hypothetical protein VHH36_03925 [Candidatus Thermoplasmatota archaeon]|nr:hypothetical protein [Candidatus Thermoplasmatota archaeon]
MSAPASPPPERGPTLEETTRAVSAAVVSAVVELLRALREEVERLQRSGEAFVGRLKGSLARSLRALQRALLAGLVATLFAAAGIVVLSVFLVAVLNRWLGDPWGTGVAAALLLLAALAFVLRARAAFRAIEREAKALAEGRAR